MAVRMRETGETEQAGEIGKAGETGKTEEPGKIEEPGEIEETGKTEEAGRLEQAGKQADREFSEPECFALVNRMGEAILSNGGEIFRADEAMRYAAKAFGLEQFNSYVIANGIFTSMSADGKAYSSQVHSVPLAPIMLCRVEALNDLSRQISAGECTPLEMERELDRIGKMKTSGNFVQMLASGCGSASFCYLFGGALPDCLAAFAAGFILYVFLLCGAPKAKLPKIMVNIAGSILVSLACCIFYAAGFGVSLDKMIIGAIFPLVPGIPLTNSVRNFLENDYLSGMIRLVDALLTAGCIAVGVGVVMKIWSMVTGGVI